MKRWFKLVRVMLVITGCCLSAPGAEPVADEVAPVIDETNDPPSLLTTLTTSNGWHSIHQYWSSNVVNAAEYIDNFFADPKLDRESNGSRLKLSLGMRLKDGDGYSFITRANFRLSLPGTSKRLKIFFEDLVESEDENTASKALAEMRDTDRSAGLRFNVRQKRRYSIDLDGGYRTSTDQFFGRIRGKRDFFLSETLKLRLTESVSYYTEDEWISKTEFDINIQLNENLLFRSESDLEWAEDIDGVRPAQTFVLFKPVSKRRAYRFEIGGDWPESPNPTETRYFTSITYRKLAHSDWVYLEIQPGVEFPQEHDYEPKSFIMVKFDFVFGKTD